jgi:hypothetical protein
MSLDRPVELQELETRLARVVEELNHLKDGLCLLGLKQCSGCGKYSVSTDGKNLLEAGGQLVCYSCVQEWWQRRSPALNSEERQAVEHKLLRWLVTHHNAKVIRLAEKLPRPIELELKIIAACEQCAGTGKIDGGKRCLNCEGRGSVWVVRLRPELQ